MRRYLIINAYSARNAGDAAIILSAVHLLRSYRHGIFSISSRYFQEDAPFYSTYGISIVPPIIPFPIPGQSGDVWRTLRFFLSLTVVISLAIVHRASPKISMWLASMLRAHGFLHLVQSDVVVVAGGGYLYSHVIPGRPNLTLLHHAATVKIATLLQKSMVMMPQSIGPLPKQLDRWVVVWGFSGVEPIVVRERFSEKEARLLFGPDHPVTLCPDVAFYGGSHPKERLHKNVQPSSKVKVGIVVMDWTWARSVGRSGLHRYINELALTVSVLTSQCCEVRLLGHSHIPEQNQDDLEVARQILQRTRSHVRCQSATIDTDSRVDSLRSIFSSLDVVIGTRLHSCILSLTAGTPAIALAYQPKARETYQLLGLEDLCLDVEDFTTAQLTQLVANITHDTDRYIARIETAVEEARHVISKCYSEVLEKLSTEIERESTWAL